MTIVTTEGIAMQIQNTGVKTDPTLDKEYVAFKDRSSRNGSVAEYADFAVNNGLDSFAQRDIPREGRVNGNTRRTE